MKDHFSGGRPEGYATRRYRGDRLRQEIAKRGADAAAWAWAMEEADNPDLVLRPKVELREIADTGEAARRERVWGEQAKPVVEQQTVTPAEPLAVQDNISFDAASEIWINIDDTLSMQTIEDMVLEEVDRYRDWRGDDVKTIKVRWWIKGNLDFMALKKPASADDIETIIGRIGTFVDRVEYVA